MHKNKWGLAWLSQWFQRGRERMFYRKRPPSSGTSPFRLDNEWVHSLYNSFHTRRTVHSGELEVDVDTQFLLVHQYPHWKHLDYFKGSGEKASYFKEIVRSLPWLVCGLIICRNWGRKGHSNLSDPFIGYLDVKVEFLCVLI